MLDYSLDYSLTNTCIKFMKSSKLVIINFMADFTSLLLQAIGVSVIVLYYIVVYV